MLLGQTWNATATEGAQRFPCDDLVPGPAEHLTRALDVAAPSAAVWPSHGHDGSRMVVRLTAGRGGGLRRLATEALGVGDLVMMRKQLRTLAALAERDA